MTDQMPPDDDDPAEAAAYLEAEARSEQEAAARRARPPGGSLRYRIGVTVALAVAALALVAGVRATQTDDDGDQPTVSGSPGVVEALLPRNGAEVLRQTEVGIDLAPGYEGRLSINGTDIPDDELRRVPEQHQVFYAPGPDRTFETLPSGSNCVTATVWRSAVGPGPQDIPFQWCFDVT
jgi:hypothetical protein